MPESLTRKESIEALRCCARIEDYSCHGCPCLDSDGVCTCDNFIEIPQALITAAIDLLDALMALTVAKAVSSFKEDF